MNSILYKLKEVLFSVLPITIIVLILNFTLIPLESHLLIRFIIGSIFLIIGLTVFLLGIDIGITPIGNKMGAALVKPNKIWVVGVIGFILGFIISIAEPDLHILAGQVASVTSNAVPKMLIVLIVSIGVALMLTLGLVRIIYNMPLNKLFTVIYGIIFVLALFTQSEFIAISFDASGATTGALTVPFMLALAVGVSALKKNSHLSEQDSFGLVGLASSGAIIAVMLMSIFSKSNITPENISNTVNVTSTIIGAYTNILPTILYEVFIALLPIIVIFLVFQKFSFKMKKSALRKIMFGVLFTYIGLVLFLLGVNAGFMEVGTVVGYKLAMFENKIYVIVVAGILGMLTILAEPAVYVLTHQIEEVTSGYIKRKSVLITLAIGVSLSVTLAVIKILVPQIQLWHYLLPGYIISIALSYYVPSLFVGIAFDSGGVASGPMTATFILAFTHGIADAVEGANVLADGFGVIAMVAMTPLIALQLLGLIFQAKLKKENNH